MQINIAQDDNRQLFQIWCTIKIVYIDAYVFFKTRPTFKHELNKLNLRLKERKIQKLENYCWINLAVVVVGFNIMQSKQNSPHSRDKFKQMKLLNKNVSYKNTP